MKRSMTVLSMACALAACGTDDPPARTAERDRAGAAENASKLTREAPATSPGSATSRIEPEVVPHGGAGGVVDSIHVRLGGRHLQTLTPSRTSEQGAGPVTRPDLDFDGHADLALVTELAAGTSRSDYWRFDPAAGRYLPLGNHETLQVDTAAKALTTFNRGGHGGRIWTAARVAVVDGALVPVRSEEQAWLDDAQAYVYVVRERRGSRLAETSRDTLAQGELRAGPSRDPDAAQQD
jgi:hypothetical protein